ncbi:MAG TPA: HAMP domain-containing sensor histidine kinase [Candidatus Binatia bacterium]|jgi:signal transduction histidine kinase|nr:HAMP domain-containing sensor histidine kinase [Candidatus Binatia bacterium]
MLVQRLPLAVAVYLPAGLALVLLEISHHPDRRRMIALRFATDAVAALTAVIVARRHPTGRTPMLASAGLLIAFITLSGLYNVGVGGLLERYVMIQVCLLNGAAVLFPWGWRPQLAAMIAAVGVFALTAPHLTAADATGFGAFGLIVAGGTSVLGAWSMDRHRFEAFVRTASEREEADIAAMLLRVAQALGGYTDRPHMLEAVNRLAVEAVGCDWTSTFAWDDRRQAYRFTAGAGLRAEPAAELERVDVTRDNLPVLRALAPGGLVEIADPDAQALVPPDLMARWDMSATLVVAIARGSDIVGMLICADRSRRGPFTERQHRVALGIAQATAIALENTRLIADLQAANQLKTEFVSTMSHELRTPLNVILGFSEMARDHALDLAERERCLERVETAGRELMELIEDTLEIGRIESGRDEVRLEPVTLSALWTELGTACGRMPRRHGVLLAWLDAAEVSVVTDPRKVTVVVRNLVGNALKFTERGSVEASARVEGDELVLRVADTGIGIRPEDQAVIFEMFRQADGSDSRRYGGVGLGLHIVRRFVTQLGGTVALDSTPGSGSAFTVRLPATAASVPARDATTSRILGLARV